MQINFRLILYKLKYILWPPQSNQIMWPLSNKISLTRSNRVYQRAVSQCQKYNSDGFLIIFFVSGIRHHQMCIASSVDISLQSGGFWATSIASFRERLLDFRSCWIVFIHVIRGCPGGLLQFSKREAVYISFGICFITVWHYAIWPNREKRRAWTMAERSGCLVVHLTSSFYIWGEWVSE